MLTREFKKSEKHQGLPHKLTKTNSPQRISIYAFDPTLIFGK
jgi:hypothetical protein